MVNKTSKIKVFVIGIDGATFDIINPLINEGKLPNISRLMREGSYGTLQSSIPPLSPTAWSSFMTGTNPAKHGILDFLGRQPDSYLANFYNASNRQEKAIWALAGMHDRKVGIMNVPSTYPPDKVNGFMISGMDTPGSANDYIYPASLEKELKQEVGGFKLEGIKLSDFGDYSESWSKELLDCLENRFVVAKYLLQKKDWDLFMVVFEATDRVQHSYWEDKEYKNFLATDRKKGDHKLVCEVYEIVDKKLGVLLEDLDEDVRVVVLSDHGFGPVNKAVRLNLWLAQQGYLSFGHSSQGLRQRLMSAKAKIKESAWFKESRILKNIIRIKKSIKATQSVGLNLLQDVDWTNTRAYCIGGTGNIFINLNGREPAGLVQPGAEYESIVGELREKLNEFTDPLTGTKLFSHVHKRSEIYKGKSIVKAPDLLLEWSHGYAFIGERELGNNNYGEKDMFVPHVWAGDHLPNGIVILHGKDIRKGVELKDANIMDVAPTILYLMGLPIPNSMDGKVLIESLSDQFVQACPVEHQEVTDDQTSEDNKSQGYSEDEAKEINKRLQDLGYI